MRGKHILWLSLIAMLLTVTMVNIGTAPVSSATKLSVDPARLPKAPDLGHAFYPIPVENEAVGTGDGVTDTFALDNKPVVEDSETVYLDGVPTTAYEMNYPLGTIEFDTAPDVGVEITADYTYVGPGDVYTVSIKIENVEDLYAAGFTVQYAPWGRTLSASNVEEGDFLKEGGAYSTGFKATISIFAGTIKVGITRLGAVPGRTATEGTLITFLLTVVEGGDSDIDIVDSNLLDSNLDPINHKNFGSKYYGATGDLVKIEMDPTGRHIHIGESEGYFTVTVRNDADVPICVRARLEAERERDGRDLRLYSGQTYYGGYLGAEPPSLELMCDGYEEFWEWDWNHYGDSPWLDAIEDGNLVNSTVGDAITSYYTFEDLGPLMPYQGIYYVISNVDFFGYCRVDDTDWDIDPYCSTEVGGEPYDLMWCDSMGTSMGWSWSGLKYYKDQYNFPEYYGFPLVTEAVDNAKLLLYQYSPGGVLMEVDALKMLVEFATIIPVDAPIYCIPPGQTVALPPITWVPVEDHIGKYDASITVEYSATYDTLVSAHFKNTGKKVHTFHFWVEE